MTDSMHHRIARALVPFIHHGLATPDEAATAVLKEMAEPDEAIRSVNTGSIAHDNDEIWRAMIAALDVP